MTVANNDSAYGTICVPLSTRDVCPNIFWHQMSVPSGMVQNVSGNCVPAPTQQVCTDTSSSDYNTGYPCPFPHTGSPADACPNIGGWQGSIPSGFVKDSSGNCVIPINVCPNLSNGPYTSIPSGYIVDPATGKLCRGNSIERDVVLR